jgi:hypothetical protein
MTAVYSHTVFGDDSLDADGRARTARAYALTLLTALDLPWVADGLQRDGPQVRAPVDDRLRALLRWPQDPSAPAQCACRRKTLQARRLRAC